MADARANPRHDRDAVVTTALRLLDEDGLPDLTMRRLAAALDVQPSALYWHVDDKQTLLALVAERIEAAARPVAADHLDWRTATAAEADAVRDAFLAYRDGAEVVLSTRALGLGAEASHRRLRDALRRGHDAATAELAATALLHLALGDAFLLQQRRNADALGVVSPAVGLDPTRTDADDAGAFRTGVALLLDGLASRVTRTRD